MFKLIFIPILLVFSFELFAQENDSSQVILIAYYSQNGHTLEMAEAVEKGAKSTGIKVLRKSVEEVTQDELLKADAIIVGSPVYNANVAPEVQQFINSWPFEGAPLKDKLGAAFVTAGGISAGEETTQLSILRSMLIFGMIVVGGPNWTQAFGASAIHAEQPFDTNAIDEGFIQKGEALGKRMGELLLKRR